MTGSQGNRIGEKSVGVPKVPGDRVNVAASLPRGRAFGLVPRIAHRVSIVFAPPRGSEAATFQGSLPHPKVSES